MKRIMKTTIFAMMLISASLAQIKMEEVELSDTGVKTEAEVINELQCLGSIDNYASLMNAEWDQGIVYLLAQLGMGAQENKKYYVALGDSHNVSYFKEGENYFLSVNRVNEAGDDIAQLKAFIPTSLKGCIRILPASCKWQGQREVKYVEVCESGIDISQKLKQDIFSVTASIDEQSMTPVQTLIALRECYEPKVYSIGFECLKKDLFFDHETAVASMKLEVKRLESLGYKAELVIETMEIRYSKLDLEVTTKEIE